MKVLPLVSAIIPAYNRKKWVQDSIESVLAQTYPNIELIIVDDGSTDGTYEHLQEKYPTEIYKLLRNEKPTGTGAAKNLGAKHATGQYLAFLDSDDLWEPRKTELAMGVFTSQNDPKLAVVGGGCRYIDKNNHPTLSPELPPDVASYESFVIHLKMPGSGSNNLIKKEIFDELGGFDESLLRAQDKDLWCRTLRHYNIKFTSEVTSVIRIHDTERVNIDVKTILNSRLTIDNRIVDPSLRKKAIAATYFSLTQRLWSNNKITSLKFFLQSVIAYPLPIADGINRTKYLIKKIIGRN